MINRFDAARKHASKIVTKYKLIPPINPIEVIRSLGIELEEKANNYGIEAYSELNLAPKIVINSEFTFPARKRFTLAHELGHIIIPWHNGDVKCNTDTPYRTIEGQRKVDTQELEANIFASELLMPHDWLVSQLADSTLSFQNCLDYVREQASTSIMACLYALEDALPPGHVYYVQTDGTDYWKKFVSKNTGYTVFHYNLDESKSFLESICETTEKFHISQYTIHHYKLLPCPNSEILKKVYYESEDIVEFINIISSYEPTKILGYLQHILNSIDDIFCAIIYEGDKCLRRVGHEKSNFKNYCSNANQILEVCKANNIEYYLVKAKNYKVFFVKNMIYDMPTVKMVDPNALLRVITQELYQEESMSYLRRINGVVSSVNSISKTDNYQLLYSEIKNRFVADPTYIEFYNHRLFETYIVNKTKSMCNNAKARKVLLK